MFFRPLHFVIYAITVFCGSGINKELFTDFCSFRTFVMTCKAEIHRDAENNGLWFHGQGFNDGPASRRNLEPRINNIEFSSVKMSRQSVFA